MSPTRHLHARKSEARELHRQRVHADLRIHENVRRFRLYCFYPALEMGRSGSERRCAIARVACFLVFRSAEIERVERESASIELAKPALQNRVPNRVLAEILGNDADVYSTVTLRHAPNPIFDAR